MNSRFLIFTASLVLPLSVMLVGCSSSTSTSSSSTEQEASSGLSLADSCAELSGVTSQLADGIGLAQDDPANAQQHLDISRQALDAMVAITSSDSSFEQVTQEYSDKLNDFLDALQTAVENGGGLEDASVTPSREAARSAGEALDSLCQ